jgi:hypothetical protein
VGCVGGWRRMRVMEGEWVSKGEEWNRERFRLS